jgi:hypothetical protein
MSKIRLSFGALALCATVSALGVAGASAETAPSLNWCAKLPSNQLKGLWDTISCTGSDVEDGNHAWAWASGLKTTTYCVLGGKEYRDELCEFAAAGVGPFLVQVTHEPPPKAIARILAPLFTATVAGTKIEITCTGGSGEGEQSAAKLLVYSPFKFTECTAVKPAKCEVSSKGEPDGTISTRPLDSKLLSLPEILFQPESGTVFVELEYKDKGSETCALNGSIFVVEGTQKCEWETGVRTPLLTHQLDCKESGGGLRIGGFAVTFDVTNHIHLSNDALWKIQ